MQIFHGMCQWYSPFIKNFASIASPLYSLLKNKTKWKWTELHQASFEALKLAMENDVMLVGINYKKPLILKCDASDKGLGAALTQPHEEKEKVIAFASRTLSDAEKNINICEREYLAVIWALIKFKEFLWGQPVIVHTDNNAVKQIQAIKVKSGKLQRWSHQLQQWDLQIVHRPGRENVLADSLSRFPVDPPPETDEEEISDIIYTPTIASLHDFPNFERLREEQLKDPQISLIIKILSLIKADIKGQREINSYEALEKKGYNVKQSVLFKEIIEEKSLNSTNRKPHRDGSCSEEHSSPAFKVPNIKGKETHKNDIISSSESIKDVGSLKVVNCDLQTELELSQAKDVPIATEVLENNKNPKNIEMKSVPVVPRSLVPEILKYFHDEPHSGHLGIRKTKIKIKSRFYWDHMNKDIQEHIRSCYVCQTVKISNQKPSGLLGNPPVASRIFEVIHVDFQGPFPASSGGRRNKYLLVVEDEFSKWLELFPMTKATAKKVADKLEDEVFCRFGAPSTIVSDNGSQFTSKILKKLCKEWNIHHAFISVYHPQPNISERANRTIKTMIASFVQQHHSSWDLHLQKFALALRSSINETTQCSPAILNLGREIYLPIDRSFGQTSYEAPSSSRQYQPTENLREIIEWVRKNIILSHQKNSILYNKKHRDLSFHPGQLVLVRNHPISSAEEHFMGKLDKKWLGPYLIHKVITPVSYEIVTYPDLKPFGNQHILNLKPFIERSKLLESPSQVKPLDHIKPKSINSSPVISPSLDPVPLRRTTRPHAKINYDVTNRRGKK